MTGISNHNNTKVMRVGGKLYCPIILPNVIQEEQEPFVIEDSDRLAYVVSPFSPLAESLSMMLMEPCSTEQANEIPRDPSFHAVLPSSTISRSMAMMDEKLFEGVSFSDTLPLSFKEEDDESNNTLQEEGFSVEAHKDESKPVKPKSKKVGNILKKSRKNHNAQQTDILMDWYLKNDGKTPSSQGKLDLAKATKLNVIQVATWFQNRKRRYSDTLYEYQTLSRKHPHMVFDYQSYKSFTSAEKKASLKQKRK